MRPSIFVFVNDAYITFHEYIYIYECVSVSNLWYREHRNEVNEEVTS